MEEFVKFLVDLNKPLETDENYLSIVSHKKFENWYLMWDCGEYKLPEEYENFMIFVARLFVVENYC